MRVQRQQDVFQLPLEGFLIEDVEEIRHVVVLPNGIFLRRFEPQENVAGKKRLAEHDRLTAIFVRRIIARQRGRDLLAIAILNEFLFPPRLCVCHEPTQSRHASRIRNRAAGVNIRMRQRLFSRQIASGKTTSDRAICAARF